MSQALAMRPHRHVLDVHSDETELAAHAAEHLRPGLAHGSPTMIVARAETRSRVESALLRLGVAVGRAREEGSLLEWDANELLEAISVGGTIDEKAFDQVVGTIARSCPDGAPLPGFGELVALLWERGEFEESLRLEALWADLGRKTPLHFYCGVHAGATERPEVFRKLAEVHDHVVFESMTDSIDLQPHVDSPKAARRFALELLRRWDRGDESGSIALVVSELVTNAVLHAGSDLTLSIGAKEDLVRIAVRDGSVELPQLGRSDHRSENGRGLDIIRTLSEDFGIFVAPDGKTVWAHLLMEPPA